MKSSLIAHLHSEFESMVRREEETGIEFWMARDLQKLLDYAKWENFSKVIQKSITFRKTSGYVEEDHFLDVRKKVAVGSGARREIDDN